MLPWGHDFYFLEYRLFREEESTFKSASIENMITLGRFMDISISSEAFCAIERWQPWITTACQWDTSSGVLSNSALAGDLLVRGKQNLHAVTRAQSFLAMQSVRVC